MASNKLITEKEDEVKVIKLEKKAISDLISKLKDQGNRLEVEFLDLRKSNIEDENSGHSSTLMNLSNPSMVYQVPSKTAGVQVAALEKDINAVKLDLSMQAAFGNRNSPNNNSEENSDYDD
uniref:Uncharacterized protein n=1 Tax=Daphnia galeata TaxID=27404 RepID=A0A8J2RSH2_9CRUS|nr:unnamed protein product [Daphnia galeata]